MRASLVVKQNTQSARRLSLSISSSAAAAPCCIIIHVVEPFTKAHTALVSSQINCLVPYAVHTLAQALYAITSSQVQL